MPFQYGDYGQVGHQAIHSPHVPILFSVFRELTTMVVLTVLVLCDVLAQLEMKFPFDNLDQDVTESENRLVLKTQLSNSS